MPDLWLWFFILFIITFFTLDAYRWFLADRPTFSRNTREWTKQVPMLPFFIGLFLGVAAGHFWW